MAKVMEVQPYRGEDLMGASTLEFPPDEENVEDEDEVETQTLVTRMMEEAIQHYEENLEPDQVKATDYYWARPFGNEVKGRSKVVTTEVRDVTLRQLPTLMRVFFSPERAVEFRGHGPEDQPVAEQQTDWVNWVVTQQNDSYRTLYEVIQDALVRRIGWTKWWWEERKRVEATEYTGLTLQELTLLASEPDAELEILGTQEGPPPPEAAPGPPGAPEQPQAPLDTLYDVRVTRTITTGRERYAAVPPEEMFFTPNARDVDSAPLVAHAREVPLSDVVEMGYDLDEIEDLAGRRRALSSETLRQSRQYHGGDGTEAEDDERDPSQRLVFFTEAYALMDLDGDGVSELRRFDCAGPQFKILNGPDGEIVDERPFAAWGANLEAHTLVGMGNYDLVGDLQLINSQILRGTLDSLAISINPLTEIVQGEVNMQDAMNTDVVKFIRVRRPGMMREVKHSFVGPDTLPMLAHTKEIEESRTGTTRASQGLDADVLQSTTKAAVTGTFSAAQQRLDLIARNLAETGMRRMFTGILKLTIKHPQPGRMYRLRGKYIPIDPRHWDATMDVQVNIGLGQGTPEDRIAALQMQLQNQMGLMQSGSPLVTNVELRATLGKLVELMGWKNSEEFYRPWSADDEQQAQQAASQQQPPPDPNMALVEIEKMKAEGQMAMDIQKFELEKWKAQMEDDRERDKLARDSALKERELELKHGVEIQDAAMKAAVALDRAAMDADVKAQQAQQQAAQQAQQAQAAPAPGGEV